MAYTPSGTNNRINPYYQKQNHVKIARTARNRREFLGTTAWTPADLFDPENPEPGAIYNMRDMSTLYQDSAGTTPVTAYGDPVGLRIDQSQGGEGAGERIDFVPTTLGNWLDNGDGSYTYTGPGGENLTAPGGVVVEGRLYEYGYTVVSIDQGAANLRIGSAASNDVSATEPGVYTGLNVADGDAWLIRAGNGALSIAVKDIFLKEIPGVHEHQPTAAARPIYSRHPKSTVRNLLDESQEFTANGAWVGTNQSALTYNITDPKGGTTAVRIAATMQYSGLEQTLPTNLVDGETYYIRLWARSDSPQEWYASSTAGAQNSARFTPTNDWVEYVLSVVAGATSDRFRLQNRNLDAAGHDVEIAFTSLAEDDGPYQNRVSAYDVTEEGVPDNFGLTYDGVDDVMVSTTTVDMSSTDKMTMMFGMNSTKPSSQAFYTSHNGTNWGSLALRAPPTSGTGRYAARLTTNNAEANLGKDVLFPDYSVVTNIADTAAATAAENLLIRVNGELGDTNTVATTAYPFGNGNIVTGAFGGAYFYTGTIYSDLIIGRLLTPEELEQTEDWFEEGTPGVEMTDPDNVYVNWRLSGGAQSGPGYGGANNPPDGHAIGWNNVDSYPELDTYTQFAWIINEAEAAGRSYLTYDVMTNHPELVEGDSITLSWVVEVLGAQGGLMLATANVADVTISDTVTNVLAYQTGTVSVTVTITGPSPAVQVRVGTGVTTTKNIACRITAPRAVVTVA